MPIGIRQYQMAIALPGQRMSYQDHTHFKGHLDGTYNATGEVLPFGRFIAKSASATPWEGQLVLPSAADTNIIGIIPQQGYYERKSFDGAVGIPVNYPTAYAYKGVWAIETEGAVTIDSTFALAADDTDEENKGKVVDSGVYTGATIPFPDNVSVKRVVDSLAVVELDLSPNLINN